jgi:hypothetical protein
MFAYCRNNLDFAMEHAQVYYAQATFDLSVGEVTSVFSKDFNTVPDSDRCRKSITKKRVLFHRNEADDGKNVDDKKSNPERASGRAGTLYETQR